METQIQEREKTRNKVLIENNAHFIFNHLKELENLGGVQERRWFWELLQNAKDCAGKGQQIVVKVILTDDNLIFKHDGEPFKEEEIIHLIYHGSTKRGEQEKTGKFGTGFMTTHLLSRKVDIQGKLENNSYFQFCLDRTGNTPEELAKSLDLSWKEFNESFSNSSHEDYFKTSFSYSLNAVAQENAQKGIVDLEKILPFVLAFNHKIASVTVDNRGMGFKVEKIVTEPTEYELIKKTIIKITNEIEPKTVEIYLCQKNQVFVAIETLTINDKKIISSIDPRIPNLFYDFPLFKTENFHFPAIINSTEFFPKTERDGIYLGKNNTEDNNQNKKIIGIAFELFLELVRYCTNQKWQDLHHFAIFGNPQQEEWHDKTWFDGKLREIIDVLLSIKLISPFDNSCLIEPHSCLIPIGGTEEESFEIWDLASDIFPERIPDKATLFDWNKALACWARLNDKDNEEFEFALTLDRLCKKIEDYETIDSLIELFDSSKDRTYTWLNLLYQTIDMYNRDLFYKFKIFLNQNGKLKQFGEIKIDCDIDDELKDILLLLDEDIREELSDKNIRVNENLFSRKEDDDVLSHTIKNIREIHTYFTDNEMQASLRMFAWLLQHEKFSELEGYPVAVTKIEDRRNIYHLSKEKKLLAPPSLWNAPFSEYADIFSDEFILHADYVELIPPNLLKKLDEEGFLYSTPLYEESHIFSKDDLLRIATGELNNTISDEDADEIELQVEETKVSKIAYFDTPSEKSAIRLARKSKKQTGRLLEFLFNCVIQKDKNCCQEKDINYRNQVISIYPSYWLSRLKDNQWVNIGKDKTESPSALNLKDYFENNENLHNALKNDEAIKFLNMLGVSVGDLTRNIFAKNDKERFEWDKACTSILSAGYKKGIEPEIIQDIFNDDEFLEEVSKKKERKAKVKANQEIGAETEKIFQLLFNSEEIRDLGFRIKRVEIGRDFEIEHDFIINEREQLLTVETDMKGYSIELKSTKGNYVLMTTTQGKMATENPDFFALCVFQHSGIVNDEEIQNNVRFVTNIGEILQEQVQKVQKLNSLTDETISTVDNIEIQIEKGQIKYKIKKDVWKDGLLFHDFIRYLKNNLVMGHCK